MESKAVLYEHEPNFKRGDSHKDMTIKEIYKKRIEDLTFNELNMIGYTNPNLFVREWTLEHGSFDNNKIVWIVVYVSEDIKHMNMKEEGE